MMSCWWPSLAWTPPRRTANCSWGASEYTSNLCCGCSCLFRKEKPELYRMLLLRVRAGKGNLTTWPSATRPGLGAGVVGIASNYLANHRNCIIAKRTVETRFGHRWFHVWRDPMGVKLMVVKESAPLCGIPRNHSQSQCKSSRHPRWLPCWVGTSWEAGPSRPENPPLACNLKPAG